MENVLIVVIILALFLIGIRNTLKHFKGQGGCCGGGEVNPKHKKLKNVLYKKTFNVSGMSCNHCKNRVEEAVNDIEGIAGRVNLKKGTLTVSYEKAVIDEIIAQKVEKAGYGISAQ